MAIPFSSPKWRNITISGRAASGATTLSRVLAEKLGWKLINGGEIYREYAKKNGIPLEKTTASDDKYHLQLDNFIKEKLKNEKSLIIESWLSGFDAAGIDGVFKVFVTCSDDSVRVDRLVNRDKMTIEEAKQHLKTREEENLKKWEKLYHTRDFWNPALYNLVIDTYHNGPTETLNLVLQAIGFPK
ncbi:cytidylate kinase family protein [Candidatus Gottesmanbacteria bacterium]|nr:cytidylate kinase family protein [Candidatus Gottesmanbacteria bacterium]